MIDETQPDRPEEPTLLVRQDGTGTPVASLDAITTLIHSFGSMMANMERRITDQIRENAAASKERWAKWEADFREYREANDRRVNELRHDFDSHMKEVEREDIVWDSRVKPIKYAGTWLGRHWRDMILLLLGILAVLGFSTQVIEGILR